MNVTRHTPKSQYFNHDYILTQKVAEGKMVQVGMLWYARPNHTEANTHPTGLPYTCTNGHNHKTYAAFIRCQQRIDKK